MGTAWLLQYLKCDSNVSKAYLEHKHTIPAKPLISSPEAGSKHREGGGYTTM